MTIMKGKTMKKLTMLLLLSFAFSLQTLHAEDKSNNNRSFWDMLRSKIEALTPQKKSAITTATGGVRGASVTSEDVYWKNEATGQTIAANEVEAFSNAIKLVDSDDRAQAKIAFAAFIKQYPQSTLRGDADHALALLQTDGAPALAK
jgi:TolA-binding protein